MKKWAIIITTLLAGSSLLLFGGCRHGHHKAEHIDFIVDYLEETLDLDTAQQAKLAEIRKEFTEKVTTLKGSRQKMRPMVKEQLAADKIDAKVIKQAIALHRQELDSVMDLAVDRLAEFHAILTPAQRQKLINKLEKWHNCQDRE
ncbi:MAG: periplasmic heavy metal sensor [Proteobacteria bacterium]|nr:periplasmic heavy metal sensor [Pseudomonadota bacterium]